MSYPSFVHICEEGPREGFQSEPPDIVTADKVKLIDALSDTGLREIACCSFVNPKKLPQMADAEEIAARIRRREGIRYTGLWLNRTGFDRARATPLDLTGTIVSSASETFSIRNSGRDKAAQAQDQAGMITAYRQAGVSRFTAYVFTAFGCNLEGDISVATVLKSVKELVQLTDATGISPEAYYLCDTIGAASPLDVQRVVDSVRNCWPDLPIGLHLHDTRGLGMVNALMGLRLGVARFDTSIGGLGGCPFAGNRAAAGNLATEDFAFLCAELGIDTGLDLQALIECANLAEAIVGHPLPGKLRLAGLPRRGATVRYQEAVT